MFANPHTTKRIISILIILGLLSVLGLSVFADTVVQVQNSVTSTNTYLNGTFQIIINSTSSDPVLVNSFTDGSVWDYTTEQLYFIRIRLINSEPNGQMVNLHTPNLSFILSCPALAPGMTGVSYEFSTAVDFILGDITTINFRPSDGLLALAYNNRNIYVGANSTINMFVCLKRITQIHSTNSAYTYYPSLIDAPVSSITIGQTYNPTNTTDGVSSDNSYILKSLYENSQDIENAIQTIITNDGTYAAAEQRWLIDIARNISDIEDKVQSILDAWNTNSQQAGTLTNDSNNLSSDVATVHNQESTWYAQNTQAIESTGLTNFQYTQNQQQGLTGVQDLFNSLWTSLGDWNFVYTFTILMSFCMYLLRHRTYKQSSGGGKKQGSSKASNSGGS